MRTATLLLVLGAALVALADETTVDPVRIPAIVDLNNATCPVQGDPIDADSHVDWNGVRVHLCCPDCKPLFEKEPAAALEKLGLKVAKDAEGKTVVDLANAKCPMMGKPAKPDAFADLDGVRTHFCCAGCPKKAKKDPAKAYEALGYVYIPAVIDLRNRTCPTTGKPSDETVLADADGIRVRFCCPDCIEGFRKDPAATFKKLGVDPAKLKESVK
jgi:YHS domain-containing protein